MLACDSLTHSMSLSGHGCSCNKSNGLVVDNKSNKEGGGFYAGAQDVDYSEQLVKNLFFWKNQLVRVIRKNGGDNQVCVELESNRGIAVGFPPVRDLCRAIPYSEPNTDTIVRLPTRPFNLSSPADASDLEIVLQDLLNILKNHIKNRAQQAETVIGSSEE